MKTTNCVRVIAFASLLVLKPAPARAHCDTLDGPVVRTAQAALTSGDVTPVLKWIRETGEPEIRAAFARALEVRKLSPAAAALADRFFFETLVRVHRAGEGEPFTGLQPAGVADSALAAADQAIANGRADALVANLVAHLQGKLLAEFKELSERRAHMNDSVAAGRVYVEAYVTFIHHYERLSEGAEKQSAGHHH
jgi:hypothetical protein